MIRLTLELTDTLTPGLGELGRTVDDELARIVSRLSERLRERLRAAAPKRTGAGAATVGYAQDGLTAVFEAVDYLVMLVGGTRPHTIAAQEGGVLAFFWEKVGADVFFRSVHHPGTRPNDYRERPLAETARLAETELEQLANLAAANL